jgi:SAM-dependent methyltransferase
MAASENGCVCCPQIKIYLKLMLLNVLKSLAAHPLTRRMNLDSPETTIQRLRIVQEKPFLKKFYHQCYQDLGKSLPVDADGPLLELGSGGGFLKKYIPGLITSEILQIPGVDIILDGQRLPFKRAALRGIVMIDVFHHLPDVRSFLTEAADCVKPGGTIVMIEPWNTAWSRLIFRFLHHEPFRPGAQDWHFSAGGPLSIANQALPWIVFKRDQEKFKQQCPQWHIENIKLSYPFCYLLSGGLAYRSFMPGFSFGFWRTVENCLQTRMDFWAMFAKIVLIRNR